MTVDALSEECAILVAEIAANNAQVEKLQAEQAAYDEWEAREEKLRAEKEAFEWKVRQWLDASSYTRGGLR
jgi:hypothetical protein